MPFSETVQANLVPRDPGQPVMVKMERYKSNDLKKPNLKVRDVVEGKKLVKTAIMVLGVLGVTLIIADGILTPAQSVLGAIQGHNTHERFLNIMLNEHIGLNVKAPHLTTNDIVGISCAIIGVLFFIQPFGTSVLATTFGPIVVLWLLFNLAFGIHVSCPVIDPL